MNRQILFFGAIIIALIGIAGLVYYLIPGYDHLFVTSGDPKAYHLKHAAVFGALALVSIIAALVTRPRAAE